jgi:hypothetical protein
MLLSMALCHILPEADAMYSKYLVAQEAIEHANEAAELEHDHDGDGVEDYGDEEHEGEEEEHHEGEEEEDHDDHDEEEEGHDDHEGHEEEGGHGFPFAYTMFFCGFMLMLILDKVLFNKSEIKVNNISIKRESIVSQGLD